VADVKQTLRVVKVGGSLFDWPQLPERLAAWIAAQSPGRNVLIAGGGSLADAVRQFDARFKIGDEASHWLCVDLLDITARMLHRLILNARLCDSLDDCPSNDLLVFAPAKFLRECEPRLAGCKLPHSWRVTSDSIAARIAEACHADELVLLKSALPKEGSRSTEFVDAHFAQAVSRLPQVRLVNLRSESFEEARCD
jgi:5-(aminomethyl)-3-furanmethanol phosphate kinase